MTAANGIFCFDEVKIFAPPNSDVKLYTITSLVELEEANNQKEPAFLIDVSMRQCVSGESLIN